MITLQAYRVAVGTFQCKLVNIRPKCSTYGTNGGNRAKNDYRLGGKIGPIIKIISLLFIFGVNVNNSYSKICQEASNKNNHILNGNISKKGNFSLYT